MSPRYRDRRTPLTAVKVRHGADGKLCSGRAIMASKESRMYSRILVAVDGSPAFKAGSADADADAAAT